MGNLTEFANKKYLILRYILEREGIKTTISDISTSVRVNRTDVVRIISQLVSSGYIQKSSKCFYLSTPLGKRIVKKIEEEL